MHTVMVLGFWMHVQTCARAESSFFARLAQVFCAGDSEVVVARCARISSGGIIVAVIVIVGTSVMTVTVVNDAENEPVTVIVYVVIGLCHAM